ncbi:MAG: endonuclease, partial [Modestobacter sp.]|nr:endonuclease [Modestobacter sp.]
MGELRSALDALAADDLKPMFGPQLLDRLAELLREQNRIAAEVIRTVRECELTQAPERDGLTTMPSWLRGHGPLAEGEAARLVGAGRVLEQLPAVAAGFAEGVITAGQVGVIARI